MKEDTETRLNRTILGLLSAPGLRLKQLSPFFPYRL